MISLTMIKDLSKKSAHMSPNTVAGKLFLHIFIEITRFLAKSDD
jgi:hypothetical protein